MVAFSAPDAISPALQRMRAFLFQPFRLGTFLKLCLVALVTEGSTWNFHSTWSGNHHPEHVTTMSSVSSSVALAPGNLPPGFNPAWIAAIAAIAIVSLIVGFVLFYLITRLRFAYFHCLVQNTREIRPGWRLYRDQATRFFWMNVSVLFCFIVVVALVALSFAAEIWRVAHASGGNPAVGPLLMLILPLVVIVFAIIVVAVVADIVLRDFMLPHYALENASAGQAWSAAWHAFRAEPGGFIGYGLLRIFLPLVAWVGIFLILILPTLLTVAAVALVEIGIHAASAHASGALPAEGIVLQVIVGAVALAVTALVWIGIGGTVNTAVREYALVFYAGRYQRLGDVLAPARAAAASM